jgi:hypothetical protein
VATEVCHSPISLLPAGGCLRNGQSAAPTSRIGADSSCPRETGKYALEGPPGFVVRTEAQKAAREKPLPFAFAEIFDMIGKPLPRSCVIPVQSCQDQDRTFETSGALTARPT